MPEGIAECVAELQNGPIHYYRAGETGRPIVLLHGGGTDTAWLSWKKAIPALAPDYRVYAPDWPGHGGSKQYRGKATQEMLEGCLLQLLDAWGLQKATLVGLSMGASVAAGFTIGHPERVARLVLTDSGGLTERVQWHLLSYLLLKTPLFPQLTSMLMLNRPSIRYSLEKQFFKSRVPDLDEIVGEVYQELKAKKSIYSDWQLDEIGPRRLKTFHLPELGRIRCPTLVVNGSLDHLVPVEAAKLAAEKIPKAKFEVIAGCGHWPNREKPDEFNRILQAFLKETDADLPPA
ncbi:putative hydrolase (alpha/beta fold family) [Methanocella arvoryzae MRE50]|uniref:Hydrolase (Alpha/beta fold family) n=1 Tax=Methanocella arvoryzae (strain DSM 22066 / NBRC 105507 / MRE50) TaxID=351160 RepID=Q0W2N6_METAR|nr:putative hydrolase (alpha/beta fold family) [Methanocella arvoryzae MRE50]